MKIYRVLLATLFVSLSGGNIIAQNATISLFDGSTLNGWEVVDPAAAAFWTVKEGIITGGDGHTKITKNTYIRTVAEYKDFEFRCLLRLRSEDQTSELQSIMR